MNYNDPENVPPVWQVGDVILDRYEVKQVFTGGGMGLVYRVHHRDWAMDLAVKSPRPEFFQTQQHIEDFEREAETWVNLGLHPHTVSCYYIRCLGGIPRIFTEFVDGGSLTDWIRSRRLYEGDPDKAMERILDIAIQFAWGLNYAHEQGLIHQDVKPGNVLMNADGSIKVTDFGLANARRALAEASTGATRAGQSILVPGSGFMTPAYCSPEQSQGKPLSRKTDIWSWAVSILELLMGEVTWASGLAAPGALADFYEDHSDDDPLYKILQNCLRNDPDARPARFLDIAIELVAMFSHTTGHTYPRQELEGLELLADSLNNRAVSLIDLNRSVEADAIFAGALRKHAGHLELAYNAGLLNWHRAQATDETLITAIEQAHHVRGDQWRVKYLLGLVHTERRDMRRASQELV